MTIQCIISGSRPRIGTASRRGASRRGVMTNSGFYEQKSIRPGGLALVLALHAAAFTGLVLVKTDIVRSLDPGTDVIFVPNPLPPPEDPPPQPERLQQPSRIDTPIPIVRIQPVGPVVRDPPLPP